MILYQSMQKNKVVQESDEDHECTATHWPKELKTLKKIHYKVNRCQENCVITEQLSNVNTPIPHIK